jgi:hypothetical protein
MTTLPPVELSPELEAQFGTIINNLSPDQAEWEQKAEALSKPLNLKLRLTPTQHIRLERIAKDSNLSVEQLVTQCVGKLCDSNIGAPTIKAPSFAQGQKVSGYTGSVRRA